MKQEDKNKVKKIKWTSIIILFVSLSALVYSSFSIFSILKRYRQGKIEYEDLKEYISEDSKDLKGETSLALAIDFENLKKINPDIVGWIFFENTEVSYPIVKGYDNNYYLNHTFMKSENIAGSIFMDYENDSKFKDMNTIIYGHNMKNGTMFSILNKYVNKEFYDNHKYFWIYTEEEIYKCEIFSAYKTSASNSKTYTKKFDTQEEYEDFLKELKLSSLYDTGISLEKDDIVLTLSTCVNNDKDSRFIVNSKMVKQ